MSERGPALYGPASGGGGSEVTEIFYHYQAPASLSGTTDNGFSVSAPDGVILPQSSDQGITILVRVPTSWTTLDIVAVVQAVDPGAGDLVLRAFYGIDLFWPAIAGTVTVPAGPLAAAPTEVVMATGVAAVEYAQLCMSRLGTDGADTYPLVAYNMGILLRKAS